MQRRHRTVPRMLFFAVRVRAIRVFASTITLLIPTRNPPFFRGATLLFVYTVILLISLICSIALIALLLVPIALLIAISILVVPISLLIAISQLARKLWGSVQRELTRKSTPSADKKVTIARYSWAFLQI